MSKPTENQLETLYKMRDTLLEHAEWLLRSTATAVSDVAPELRLGSCIAKMINIADAHHCIRELDAELATGPRDGCFQRHNDALSKAMRALTDDMEITVQQEIGGATMGTA